MSEAPDQPVAEAAPAAPAPGVEAAAPATTETTTDEDIGTEAFDRMPEPQGDEDAGAGDGQTSGETPEVKPEPVADPETVEVERNGQKFKVPKALEAELMMDADYRRKTQALAEDRRQLEAAAAESLKQFRTEHLALHQAESSLAEIDTELAAYRKFTPADWEATKTANRANYDAHMERYKDLQGMRTITSDAVEAAKTELATKETSLTESRTAAEQAKLNDDWQKANVVLAKDIPSWGEAKFKEIGAFLTKTYGVTDDQLRRTPDPIAWKMANEVMSLRAEVTTLKAANTQKAAAASTAKTLEVTPAAKPAGTSAAPRGVRDELSDAEWFRRRAAQKARKAG